MKNERACHDGGNKILPISMTKENIGVFSGELHCRAKDNTLYLRHIEHDTLQLATEAF